MIHEFLADVASGILEFIVELVPNKKTRRFIKLAILLIGIGLFGLWWYAFRDH